MSLVALRDNLRALLRTVPEAGVVPANVPAQLGDDTTTVVYLLPGDTTPFAHAGANGTPAIQSRDVVVIEHHIAVQRDEPSRGDDVALPALDAFRVAIWAAILGDRLGGAVTLPIRLGVDFYGGLEYGSQDTFGFRLLLEVVQTDAVAVDWASRRFVSAVAEIVEPIGSATEPPPAPSAAPVIIEED